MTLLKKRSLIKGALVVTAFALTVKLFGMLFRLYLTGRIGSEGIGLYQLILSLYGMFTTLATAGITVTVSRLAAECAATGGEAEARRLMWRAVRISLGISLTAGIIMFCFSGLMSNALLSDPRAATALRILAFSMPFMGAAACLKGWFFAAGQPVKPSCSSLLEQTVKISVIFAFLNISLKSTNDLGRLCAGIAAGLTLGEIFSTCFLLVLYAASKRTKDKPSSDRRAADKKIISVCAPIALSTYLTSLLHTGESLLIPGMFERYGGDRSSALSQFGVIRGMVIPILFFPFSFLSSLISVMIPEISRLNTMSDRTLLRNKTSQIFRLSWIFAIAAGGLFFCFPSQMGQAFYRTDDATRAIRILAAVTPFMYIETLSDGMLKSIGEQLWTLKVGIINSVLRITVILTLIPATGSDGYLLLLVVSNTFSFVMCYYRVKKTTGAKTDAISSVLIPLIGAAAGGAAGSFFTGYFSSAYAEAAAVTASYLAVFAAFTLAAERAYGKLLKKSA